MPGAAFGVPVWLAALCALVLLAVLALIAGIACVVFRRAEQGELPNALLGLSHVISALCGLLPWGRPATPPALPEPSCPEPESPAPATVVLVRGEPAGRLPERGGAR
ncbi:MULTISPECIES: hypothetical protein [Actinomycetes]|uniref:hypothetical protein n=1 Tax=Actinomycetes TaxID=1760 RepID=UPI0011AF23A8|nr:hypothetical protein [Streptomyces noursei]